MAKADLPNLSFLIKQLEAFISDDNGVIILARNKSLEMRSLDDSSVAGLSTQEQMDLYLRDHFPALEIAPWNDKRLSTLRRFQNSDVPHILVSKYLPDFNLKVYVDSKVEGISTLDRNYFWFTLLIGALGSVVILVVSGMTFYFQSIKRSKELLWAQANFDTLTGLPNRDLLRDRLNQEIQKSNRTGLPLAVVLIDLDQFKEVNDTLGHDMGDKLLGEAARRVSNCLRNSDTIARLGGDEFIVVVPQLGNIYNVESIAQKIIINLAEPFLLGSEVAHISASLGISFYPNDANSIDDLMKNADQAMYLAKKNGRNRFNYFTQQLQEEARKRLNLIKELRVALSKQQFRVYFQPIIDLTDGQVHKAEALLRWIHPQLGMVNPAEFIPLAEETKLIVEIGAWVRNESAIWCKRWNELCTLPFQVSVNRSPVEFMAESGIASISTFIEHLHTQGMTGKNFVFEITEGTLLNFSNSVSRELISLRDAGIQVALDDFGTGYSSLSYLKKLDIDYLKIDRSFVSNLAPDSDDLVLCEAIISMAHKLGLKVIAEGVETSEQRDLLIQADCDFAQGYFYSRPIPPEEFEMWIKKWNQQST